MRALLRYSTMGLAAILTMAYVSVSAETGISAFRPTVLEPAAAPQTVVNRSNKGDRQVRSSSVTTATVHPRPVSAVKERKILEGCDPAFSPLTESARNNYASRCLS